MKKGQVLKRIGPLIEQYRVTKGQSFHLADIDPDDTGGLDSGQKSTASELLTQGVELLAEYQDKLYANDRWGLLLVFQAMDAAGKDSTIKHVMSGVNPQGCEVFSFKQPSAEDLDHDFMWRYWRCFPERGRIGIFNRSYYEEVLVVRVHKHLLTAEKLPPKLITKDIWKERLSDIANFEDYLSRNGIKVLKFFLHVSHKEQKKRFLQRLDNPDKNWKFSLSDVAERQYWKQYMAAYEDAIRATATSEAPWYVVPANNKWFTRLVVAAAVVECLRDMDLHYPVVDKTKVAELQEARQQLEQEGKR